MFETRHDMPACLTMESYGDTLACILSEAKAAIIATVSIKEAVGNILAEDLYAPISVPTFDNSAMDGFAFCSRSTDGASSARPVSMPIVGASIAGDAAGLSHLQPGFAAKIMTGAPMPEGADTILPVERASWDHEKLTFYEPYPAHKHVRCVGEDVKQSELAFKKGTRISAQHIPFLCALGLVEIKVSRKPRTAWITTGQEISDDFNHPLMPGHIYNATGLFGGAAAADMGLDLTAKETVRDTPQDFAAALDRAIDDKVDIIISTGGVSAGQYDFVKPVLEEAGARILVHKARIKPAKPVLFAVLPNGTYFFGLPGNPISTALALRVFVYPFVRKLQGLSKEIPSTARLSKSCSATLDKTVFLMGNASITNEGMLDIVPQPNQQSFQTKPFAASNAWIIVPEGTDDLMQDARVQWLPINPNQL